MAKLSEYLVWRGDLSFDAAPWNAVDGLLMAVLSYLRFHGVSDARGWTMEEAERLELMLEGNSGSYGERVELFKAMAGSVRFGNCRMHHQIELTDSEKEMQFSAICLDMPDGTECVAFRGTDNTIIGWREDFNMAYTTRVPAQEAAIYYLARVAELTDRPLRVVGHSKGGNLGVYAAASLPEKVQNRIESIWSYDSPGMNREMSQTEGYLRIRGKIRSYVPQTSIIGMLMEYYQPYTVLRSTASGISQHDPLTWQVHGPGFEELPEIDQTASVVRETLHEWLQNSTPEQRAAFVEALFRLVDTTKATKMSDLTGEKLKSLLTMVGNRKEVDPNTRRVFSRLMAQAVTLGFGNVIDRVRGRSGSENDGEWETMDRFLLKQKAAQAKQAAAEENGKETPGAENALDKNPTV